MKFRRQMLLDANRKWAFVRRLRHSMSRVPQISTLKWPHVFVDVRATRTFIRRANKRDPMHVFSCFRGLLQSPSRRGFSETAEEFLASFLDLCLLFIQLGHHRCKSTQKQLHNALIWHLSTETKYKQTAI